MSARTKKTTIIDVDMTVVAGVLERARAALSGEDYACLAGLVQTLAELSKLVRERGTTIARLRRLFGLRGSEKTADLFGDGEQPEQRDSAHPAATSDSTEPATSSTGASADAGNAQPSSTVADGDADGAANATPDGAAQNAGQTPARREKAKGHGRVAASAYEVARRCSVQHDSLHVGDSCPDCARGKLYQLSEPATIVRIIGQAPLAATAWDCERLRCSGCGNVFTAPAPDEAQGPKYDDTAVGMMALLRYGTGVPLHRLARLQLNLETPVPASTQWEVVRDRVSAFKPVFHELRRQAAQGRILHNDDTSMPILEFAGKRRAQLLAAGSLPYPDRTGLFTTAIVAVTGAGLIALFFTGRSHGGENLAALLDERDPTLASPVHMCDGLDRNLPFSHSVIPSNCLSHGRRHVVDEVENFPDQCRHVLEQLAKVFENEAACRKLGLSGEQRLEFHQRESGPVMAELKKWIQAELDEKRVEPNSGLGEAFRYLLKRWNKLTTFLRVPDAPLENNLCERVLKMAIRHRNNSLFYRSLNGAHVGDIYMTLIYTAELHGENPFDYLTALLKHEAEVACNPAAWLPWTFRATLAALAVDKAARRAA